MEVMEGRKERKIMVAVDESEESMAALSWCLRNFFSFNSHITLVLLYVKPPPIFYSTLDAAGFVISSDKIAAMEEYKSETAKLVMERARVIYSKFGHDMKVKRIIGQGDAKKVICKMVEEVGADSLVMGSHGYNFFERALFGSVSEYCAKRADCPVVLVKKHPRRE